MSKRETKMFNKKRFTRHNSYATKTEAQSISRKLRNNNPFHHVRIEKDVRLKAREWAVWKRQLLYQRYGKKFKKKKIS